MCIFVGIHRPFETAAMGEYFHMPNSMGFFFLVKGQSSWNQALVDSNFDGYSTIVTLCSAIVSTIANGIRRRKASKHVSRSDVTRIWLAVQKLRKLAEEEEEGDCQSWS